jgi:hypothetical protein
VQIQHLSTGTVAHPGGVVDAGTTKSSVLDTRRAGLRAWAFLLVACVSLLGQGERFRVDLRLRTPERALATYWEALQDNDPEAVADCVLGGTADLPFPGMLWFLPPTRACRIDSLRILPLETDRVVAAYEVRFRPIGSRQVRMMPVTTELVRIDGEWRVLRPLGEEGLLRGRVAPQRFDI